MNPTPNCLGGLRWVARLFAFCILGSRAIDALAGDASDRFYDPVVVQTIHLEIKPEDLDRMHRALPQRIYVPATFRWNDQTLQPVGIRYKGNSSSSQDSSHKRAFLVAFSEFNKGQRFLGLRHVALDLKQAHL
jgi:spore coat protein CotH